MPSVPLRQDLTHEIRRRAVPMLLAFLVVLIAGLFTQATYTVLSPVDEMQHLDASIKASQGRWVLPRGEKFGPEAMRLEACHGLFGDAIAVPACSSPTLSPDQFQEYGYNSAAGRISPYYPVTGYGAALLERLTSWDFLESARAVNVLILALGAALVAGLAARASGSSTIGASLGVCLGLLPPVLTQGVTVNPDSWSLLAGGAVTGLALARKRMRHWTYATLMTAVLVLAVLIKPNFLVLAFVPIVIVWTSLWSSRREPGEGQGSARSFLIEVIPLAVATVAFFLPALVAPWLTPTDVQLPQGTYLAITPDNPWSIREVVDQTLTALVPTTQPTGRVVPVLAGSPLPGLSAALGFFLLAPTVVGLMTARLSSRLFGLSMATAVGLVLSPVMVFAYQRQASVFFDYPYRYSFVVLPVAALASASLRHSRRWVYGGVAGATVVLVIVALVMWNRTVSGG